MTSMNLGMFVMVVVAFFLLGQLQTYGGQRGTSDVSYSYDSGSSDKMKITSRAFGQGQPIPERYTCDGQDISPALNWSGLPAETVQLALIVDDPDAPTPQPWVHWVIYGIPAEAGGLAEDVPTQERLDSPAGALQGINTWPKLGYGGPAPPEGHGVHHYHFKLYALDRALDLEPGLDKDGLLKAMEGHILGQAELVGTYER